jgi:hypothetical protein
MASRAKRPRALARFTHPVRVEARQASITPLESLKHLDIAKLEGTARAEIELGFVEGSCCRPLVRAIVRRGMVTELAVDHCPETKLNKMGADLRGLLKIAKRRLKASGKGGGPTLPTPVRSFFSAAPISVKGLTCFEICLFGWCIACCTRTDIDSDWFCGRLTIDTTSNPYPE